MKGSLVLLFGFLAAIILTARPGDPALFPAGEDGIDVLLVGNGYHAGLAIPLAPLAAVATRFRQFDWIEVGWGDADFYRATPTAASLQARPEASHLILRRSRSDRLEG
ncbi:DUF2459 domain-containing protein [Microvirga alba]|uniref:DUF2459 domain-containing protein n=1 Tax=Microvirga alba TaxID=2791025 RepID=A0A931FSV9_9HYPH|nr:DUF2459 domain-containing protein [Microvirga alba]MBF9234096.1 DUF2459 domain-containing protein [Microvirga alba]